MGTRKGQNMGSGLGGEGHGLWGKGEVCGQGRGLGGRGTASVGKGLWTGEAVGRKVRGIYGAGGGVGLGGGAEPGDRGRGLQAAEGLGSKGWDFCTQGVGLGGRGQGQN